MTRISSIGGWVGAAFLAAAATCALVALARQRRTLALSAPKSDTIQASEKSHSRQARRINQASTLLAAAALADSAIEHYRGSFHNRMMYLPLGVALQTVAVGLHGVGDERPGAHVMRDVGHGAAFATGIIGTGFHLYNVTKRPGGFSWLNLFYAAPLGAPAALSLAGMLGVMAERVRDGDTVGGVATAPLLARLIAGGLIGTAAEAGLLHFRGAYHNPAMFIPITAPPLAAALLAGASFRGSSSLPARWMLRLLVGVGFAGSTFHAYGIQRSMGGWRNWSQNLLNGPPLPAPPSFTALAMAGLASLSLIEDARA
ncbi:MAG TPA: hypothetical protein VHW90_08915 [Stellaceae bacterium]|jgi:hypothetical protein|nr:hypothetical protein [Stellaceae bacterium]